MLLHGQRVFALFAVVYSVAAIRVDTGKVQPAAQTPEFARGKEKFNPGLTQNGGWHQPESAVLYGDNAWKEADLSVFGPSKDEVSRLSEGHGVNFNDGSTSVKVGQIASFSSDSGQQLNGFSGGSLNSGGDLVVGQGSVQRPANVGVQYHSAFSQGETSFPVHAKIGADTSQYSQVVSTHSKAPVGGISDYNIRQQIANSEIRQTQVKPVQSQYHGTKPIQQQPVASQTFGHKISQTHGANQYPSKPVGGRPPATYHQKVSSKPLQPQYKPEVHYTSPGSRYPAQKPSHYPLRGGAKPVVTNKYPGQPIHQFPKSHQQAQVSRGSYPSGTF